MSLSVNEGSMDALDVRVRRVEDLAEGAVWLPSSKILLLDFDLTNEEVAEAIDEILPLLVPDEITFD